jgi:hypothetical protein
MNKRIRWTIITLHVIAALSILLAILLVMFVFRYMPSADRPALLWKLIAAGLTLSIGAESLAWALRKDRKWVWVMALIFCCLNLPAVLLPLGLVSVLGTGYFIGFVCKNGFIDCRGITLAELCKSAELDCGLMQLSLDVNPARNQVQTFNINIGDHVAPDRPAPGAGRIETPNKIHQYHFSAAPGTVITLKPETPCTFGNFAGGYELNGPSETIGGSAICMGHDRIVLKNGGPYILTFNPGATGEYAFTLVQQQDIVQQFRLNLGDLVAPDKPDPGAGRIETPGSYDHYTFTAKAGTVVDIQRKPPCVGNFYTEQSMKDEYGTTTSKAKLDCSGPTSIRVESQGVQTFSVSGYNGETGDYSFKIKLEDQLVSFPNGIKCYKPVDYDRINRPGLTVQVKGIVDLETKNEQKVERLVQLSIEKDDIDVQRYRVCEEHGNGITDKETYSKQREIIHSWRKASWAALKLR